MKHDNIVEVGIDDKGSIYIRPATAKLAYIYREGMDVGWDPVRQCLFSHEKRQWSYARWFQQLCDAAREQSILLKLVPTTIWSNVPEDIRSEIEAKFGQ